MKLRRFLLPLLLLGMLVGCGSQPSDSDAVSSAADGATSFPGGILPTILIGQSTYTCTGLAFPLYGTDAPGGEVYVNAAGATELPDGYTEAGTISSVTQNTLSEEFQLRAGFDATGTIYTSQTTPEVVYVLLSSNAFDAFDEAYFRFVSDARAKDSIFYQGNLYLADFGDCSSLKELPTGCQQIGTLHFIGIDGIPTRDLETNHPGDTYSKALEGREVYFDPNNPEILYLYALCYWAQGEYPAYLPCPILP